MGKRYELLIATEVGYKPARNVPRSPCGVLPAGKLIGSLFEVKQRNNDSTWPMYEAVFADKGG